MAALSLKTIAACAGLASPLSARRDILVFGDFETDSLATVLASMQAKCTPNPDNAKLVELTGTATLTKVAHDEAPSQSVSLQLNLRNVASGPVKVSAGQIMLCESGGFVNWISPTRALGLFGPNDVFAGKSSQLMSGAQYAGSQTIDWGAGSHNVVVALHASSGNKEQHLHVAIPTLRDGFPAPPKIQTPAPVFIGLWVNPGEVMRTWRGEGTTKWLVAAGQIVNTSENTKPTRVLKWHATVKADGKIVRDEDLTPAFYRLKSDQPPESIEPGADGVVVLTDLVSYFVHGFDVSALPVALSKATLRLELEYEQAEKERTAFFVSALINPDTVALASPLKPPTSGTWFFGSAPDQAGNNAHAWPQERYCYDIGARDQDDKTFSENRAPECKALRAQIDGLTSEKTALQKDLHEAAPGAKTAIVKQINALNSQIAKAKAKLTKCIREQNESFYAYGEKVHAAAGGTVVSSVDDGEENFGQVENKNTKTNLVVIDHGDGRFSGYYHLRKGKNSVSEGQSVKAGDVLGELGNSGGSSEPHLHFDYIVVDASGHQTNAPTHFTDLTTESGKPVKGIPGNGRYLVKETAWSVRSIAGGCGITPPVSLVADVFSLAKQPNGSLKAQLLWMQEHC